MSIEYLGEKVFLEEVAASGQVWVAKNAQHRVHADELDRTGLSLPVWSAPERAQAYLLNARLLGPRYEPHAIPLKVFNDAWLSDWVKGFTEVQLNPDGRSSRVLVMTSEEFQTACTAG